MRRFTFAFPAAAAIAALALVPTARADAPPKKPLVLHVGDSFVASGFAQALRPKFQAKGYDYQTKFKVGIYTTNLAKTFGLKWIVEHDQPELTIVTLGANEMVAGAEVESHRPAVKKLVEIVSHSAKGCVWSLPPPWPKAGEGILEIIRQEAAPCRLHDPAPIAEKIERGEDHVHPSPRGGAFWADEFFKWLAIDEAKP